MYLIFPAFVDDAFVKSYHILGKLIIKCALFQLPTDEHFFANKS